MRVFSQVWEREAPQVSQSSLMCLETSCVVLAF